MSLLPTATGTPPAGLLPASSLPIPAVVPGVPGAPELIVILLVAVVVFGVPLVLVAALVLYLRRDRTVEELERRIEDLEAEQRGDGGADDVPPQHRGSHEADADRSERQDSRD